MKPDCVLGEMRATIFTSPIIYDANNLQRVNSVLKAADGYMPNVVPPSFSALPFPLPGQIPNNGIPIDWEMASQKTKLRVHFGSQKIDIVKSEHQSLPTLEEDFCSSSLEIFRGIVERFNLVPTRLAYAPVYTPEFTKEFRRSDFLRKIYAINQFNGASNNTLQFRQGYLREEVVGERSIKINYVADGGEGQSIEERVDSNGMKSLAIRAMLNLTLDINTRQGDGYAFTVEEMADFFGKCINWAHTFRDFYVSI